MLTKYAHKKKLALVLSGGGVKAAAFHLGVCLALEHKGFRFWGGLKEDAPEDGRTFQLYVGSSAGAFVAALLASGYTPDDVIHTFTSRTTSVPGLQRVRQIRYSDIFHLNKRELIKVVPRTLFRKKIFSQGGFESAIKNGFKINGVFTMHGIEKFLREEALPTNRFQNLASRLFIVGSRLNYAQKAIFGNFETPSQTKGVQFINHATISQAVAASASLPPVFSPYGIENVGTDLKSYFFDGEIRDTLSTHIAADNGADLVISSYSVQPYQFNEEFGSLHEYGMPVIVNQALYQVIEQKIDRHIQHLADIRSIYQAVDGYFRQYPELDQHREKVLAIVRERVKFKPHVDYIYIHPRPQDHEMFFADHFSLKTEVLERIMRIGFKSGIHSLRSYGI